MDQTAYFNQMREKRKKEILSAARKMLLKDGPASFTMQNLAKNLDISTVTLYKYFKNMDDVLSALKDEIIPHTVAQTLDANETLALSQTKGSALEQFLLLFHSFLNEIFKHKDDLTLLLLIETYTQDTPVSKRQSDTITLYSEALDKQAELLLTEAQQNYGKVLTFLSHCHLFIVWYFLPCSTLAFYRHGSFETRKMNCKSILMKL